MILSGAVAVPFAQFGPGIGIIHLDNVQCNGSELRLANCSHLGVGVHDCHSLGDAGVICSPGIMLLVILNCECPVVTCLAPIPNEFSRYVLVVAVHQLSSTLITIIAS